MPLDKQLIDIQLQGLDTKTDAKLVAPGRMLELENARFEKTGRISKRFGSVALTGAPTTARRIHAFGDSIATINTNTNETASIYSPGMGASKEFGGLAAPAASFERILGGDQVQEAGSARIDNSTSVLAVRTRDSTGAGEIVVVWYDETSKKPVATYRTGIATTINDVVRICSTGGLVLVSVYILASNQILIYEVTTTTKTLRATLTTASSYSAAGVCASGSNCDWAVDSTGTYLFVANVDSASTSTIRLWRITISGWATTSVTWVAGALVRSVAVCAYTDVRVFWSETTNGLSTRTYSNALVNTLASTVVVAGVTVRTPIAAAMNSSGIAFVVWQEEQAGSASAVHYTMQYRQVSTAGVASGATTTRGLALGSKPYVLVQAGSSRVFVVGTHSSPAYNPTDTQRFCALVEVTSSNQARARLAYNVLAGPLAVLSITFPRAVPQLHQVGSVVSKFSCATMADTEDVTGTPQTAARAMFDYATSGFYDAVEVGGSLLISGGVLQCLDGVGIRENGYLTYPTVITAAESAGGSVDAGVYSIIAVYKRVDSLGRIVRSAPSVPFQITTTGISKQITVTVTSYCIGSQEPGVYDSIEIYRTVKNGSTYYLCAYSTVKNTPTTNEITTITSEADNTLSTRAVLYTQGGELDNHQPDAPYAICADKDRLWVADRLGVFPSKPFITGFAPAFMPDFYKSVASAGGPITALARMDGKTFAFKERDIFVSGGEGPDVTGANDTMSDFERLYLESGAVGQNYVVRTSNGIMARGNAGFYTVKRDLSIEYSGAPVESYNSTDLRDCCFVADTNQAHFALASGVELIYNTQFGQWCISNETKAIAICAMDGVRAFVADPALSATAGVYKQSTGYTDAHLASASYQLRLLTGWIKFANIQGFMRAYELLIAGNSRSSHSLLVRIAYDYVSTLAETHTMTSANATAGGSAYQLKVKFAQQKCEAFQVEISDVSVFAEGYDIDGLAVLAGIKRGGFKTRAEKVV